MIGHDEGWRQLRSRMHDSVSGLKRRRRERRLEAQLVWIMGSPRTGSTWLLNQLGWLLDAPMIDEPLVGAHLGTPTSVITGRPVEAGDEPISRASAGRADYFFSEAHAATWEPALRAMVLRRLYASLPTATNLRPVIVKEPNGAPGAPMLLRSLPRSRLLFLVRDGRDVVDSVLDGIDGGWIAENFGLDLEQYGGRRGLLARRAEQWVRDISAVQEAYDAHDPTLRFMLRYEDLREQPVEHLGRVLDWLGRPTGRERVQDVVDQLSSDRVRSEDRGPGKFVRAATPGLWRQSFDDEDTALLEGIMGGMLDRLGYR